MTTTDRRNEYEARRALPPALRPTAAASGKVRRAAATLLVRAAISDDGMEAAMSDWMLTETAPKPDDGLVSNRFLAAVEGVTYEGYSHINGCFYSTDRKVVARIRPPEPPLTYNIGESKPKVQAWMPLPEPPEEP